VWVLLQQQQQHCAQHGGGGGSPNCPPSNNVSVVWRTSAAASIYIQITERITNEMENSGIYLYTKHQKTSWLPMLRAVQINIR
jgi:hypothetical protein